MRQHPTLFNSSVESIRHKESRSSSTSLLHGISHVGEDGTVQVRRARLLGVGTTDDLGACCDDEYPFPSFIP